MVKQLIFVLKKWEMGVWNLPGLGKNENQDSCLQSKYFIQYVIMKDVRL